MGGAWEDAMGLGSCTGRVMGLEGARVGNNGPAVCMGRAERRGQQAGAE